LIEAVEGFVVLALSELTVVRDDCLLLERYIS
jgi:hypothetical protein